MLAYGFVISLLLTSLGINGADIGMPAAMTGNRLGVLLSICLLAMTRRRWKVTPSSKVLIAATFFVFVWGVLSASVNSTLSPEILYSLTGWLWISIYIYVGTQVIPTLMADSREKLVEIMTTTGCIVAISVMVFVAARFGHTVFSNTLRFRQEFDASLAVGLNRFMNGLFFWSIFPIAASVGIVRVSTATYISRDSCDLLLARSWHCLRCPSNSRCVRVVHCGDCHVELPRRSTRDEPHSCEQCSKRQTRSGR